MSLFTQPSRLLKSFYVIRAPSRGKKYYKQWQIPYSLEDDQTLASSKLDPYNFWDQEWKASSLSNELKAFDISRLPGYLRARSAPTASFFKPKTKHESTIDYRRRLFGIYGLQSTVDPSTIFADECRRVSEYDSHCDQVSIKDIMQEAKRERKIQEEGTRDRMAKVKKNLERMPELIEKHHEQLKKQQLLAEEKAKNRQKVLEEARDRYGYYLSPQDPKFKQLAEEIDEREKTGRKQQPKKKSA